MAAYQRWCLSRLLKGVVEAEGTQTSLSPRSRMFVSRVNKSFLMKIIAVWACFPRRARLSPSHSPRFLRQAEANDRLKPEVKRLKEAEDEKEKGRGALQGDQARSKRARVQTEERFLFLNSCLMFSRTVAGSGASDETRRCESSPERARPCPSS